MLNDCNISNKYILFLVIFSQWHLSMICFQSPTLTLSLFSNQHLHAYILVRSVSTEAALAGGARIFHRGQGSCWLLCCPCAAFLLRPQAYVKITLQSLPRTLLSCPDVHTICAMSYVWLNANWDPRNHLQGGITPRLRSQGEDITF